MTDDFTVLAGTANPGLAAAVALALNKKLGASAVERFPDGEVSVNVEESVRGREVFVIQSTGPPVNDHLIELLAFADACRRASASRITAIVPYFGYGRADRRNGRRQPIMASMVANMMETAGINHLITVDVHTPQTEGFFTVPVDNLTAVGVLTDSLRDGLPEDAVVVSPDAGRVKMATEFAHRLCCPLVVLHKQRESSTETEVTQLVGDVRGRPCLIIDDIISTGSTVESAIKALLEAGAARAFYVAATHGLFTQDARDRLMQEPVRAVFVTDTVPGNETAWPQLRVTSVAPLIAQAIAGILTDRSFNNLC